MGAIHHDFHCPSCGAVVCVDLGNAVSTTGIEQQMSAQCTRCGRAFNPSEIDQFLEALHR
jgi:predicted RNA-binding Zn-ribbon protein involved in translation (DUF1610 family)